MTVQEFTMLRCFFGAMLVVSCNEYGFKIRSYKMKETLYMDLCSMCTGPR